MSIHNSRSNKHGYNYCDPTSNQKTDEQKLKISQTLKQKYANGYIHPRKNKKLTKEEIEKNRLSHIGIKHSKETIEKLKKIAKIHYVAIIQTDENDNIINEFESVSMASERLGISIPHIVNCCKGIKRSSKYHLKYKDKK